MSQPIDNRKDLLLLVLGASEAAPVVGVTRLQKYLYLLQTDYRWDQVFQLSEPYDFRPYDFGPFDSQVYADLEFLRNVGLVEARLLGDEPRAENDELRHLSTEWATSDPEFAPWEEEDQVAAYSLTERGQEFVREFALDPERANELEGLKAKWNNRSLTELLRWLYKSHPDSATNTKLKHLTDPST